MLSIPFVPPRDLNRNCDQEDLSHVLGEIQSSLDQISTELRGLRYQIEINKVGLYVCLTLTYIVLQINAHFNKCYQLKTNLQLTRKHSNETDPLRTMFEGDLREQCRDENPIGAFTLLNRVRVLISSFNSNFIDFPGYHHGNADRNRRL